MVVEAHAISLLIEDIVKSGLIFAITFLSLFVTKNNFEGVPRSVSCIDFNAAVGVVQILHALHRLEVEAHESLEGGRPGPAVRLTKLGELGHGQVLV